MHPQNTVLIALIILVAQGSTSLSVDGIPGAGPVGWRPVGTTASGRLNLLPNPNLESKANQRPNETSKTSTYRSDPREAVHRLIPKLALDADVDITIDGRLDEAIWRDAEPIKDLVEVYPSDRGTIPELATQIRVIYSPRGLYIGFWCEQEWENHLGPLSFRDDSSLERDWFRVSVDPSGNGTHGYFMEVALGGSLNDGTLLPEKETNNDWDGPWRGATARQQDSWTGEMFLPWSMFALPKAEGTRELGIHFERNVAHLGCRWAWEPLYERNAIYLSGFSKLQINNITGKPPLVWFPYISLGQDRVTDSEVENVGFDLYWRPRHGLRLATTVLPDFAQVESDNVVINLSAFETFYQEKRAFFLEDRDIYATRGFNLIYTRRIGAPPDSPDLAVSGDHEASDILLATKVTGVQGTYRYAGLLAQEDHAEFTLSDGDHLDADGRSFLASRLLREFEGAAGHLHSIGWLGTHVDRPTIDRRALVTGIDGTSRHPRGRWTVNWQAITSRESQVGTHQTGYGAYIDFNYRPNRRWTHFVNLKYMDEHVQINDMGFAARNDIQSTAYTVQHRRVDLAKALERSVTLDLWRNQNTDGLIVGVGSWLTASWVFRNLSTLSVWGAHGPSRWDDRVSRGNGPVQIRDHYILGTNWESDSRHPLRVNVGLTLNSEQRGGPPARVITIGARYTPSDHLTLRFVSTYRIRNRQLQWWESSTFGVYDSRQIIPSLRANILFSPRQDLRIVWQFNALDANATEVLLLDESGEFEPGTADPQTVDFAISSLTGQIRYRYEFAPLSELYLVYSRGGGFYGQSDEGLSDLWQASLDEKETEQLFAKFRYRFN